MDDCCAVCAEPLEWVAYGSCGHREVCSNCVARLRFVLSDKKCCICKIESQCVFVTKALGDYTITMGDFSVFPSDATEGRVGGYWYHEDTQAFFDDLDHYKMIKAMCKLSCSICDKYGEDHSSDGAKRRSKFRSIEQLKGHLYHRHKLVMCNLCLEGRKVFICEQKLYTRAQLNQHINTGDSEVDGSESERGGFSGHPMCEFCRNPFYGDNELYLHMSTEHYTCHMCQRQHPGQYEYYRNYDDLEIHFRNEHFLCENEACLAKKFVVFQSEAEIKRHNAIEHGGHMSRSQRNAALQIPTSFRYRRHAEQDQRRGRGRGRARGSRSDFPDASDNQLSLAIQASIEIANADNLNNASSSSSQPATDHADRSEVGAVMEPFESFTIGSDSEPSARYLQAVAQSSRNARLEESSFPPLSGAPSGSQQTSRPDSEGLQRGTMAARLRHKEGGVRVLNYDGGRVLNFGGARPRTGVFLPPSSDTPLWPAVNQTSSSSGANQARMGTIHANVAPSSVSSPWNSSSVSRIPHSASAPNLLDRGTSSSCSSKAATSGSEREAFPPIGQNLLNVEDVQTANKSLVERIRAALEMDENKYTAFKAISGEYRQGLIGTPEYLAYVQQFGLSHLVVELARLLPDPQRQRELIETYNASRWQEAPRENGVGSSIGRKKNKSSRKGKEKCPDGAENSAKETLADGVINTVHKLQASYKPPEEMEVLSKDGYRSAKDKPVALFSVEEQMQASSAGFQVADSSRNNELQSNGVISNQNLGTGGSSKQRKKTSKFHRVRLGEGQVATPADIGQPDGSPELREETAAKMGPSEGLPVRGAWRNGGGQRLVALTQKGVSKRDDVAS